jgi:hypothetical protein
VGDNQITDALSHERRHRSDHLEDDAAERIDVRPEVDLAAAPALLGRHVKGSSQQAAGPGPACFARLEPEQLRDPEIQNLHPDGVRRLGGRAQEQVVGLEIAVDDPVLVGGGERVGDLPHDGGDRARVLHQAPRPRQVVAHALADQILHHDVGRAGVKAAVEHFDDARVPELRGGPRFVEEARHGLLLGRQLRQQHLDRGAPAHVNVLPQVDVPHSPAADAPNNPVVADDLAGARHSSSLLDRWISSRGRHRHDIITAPPSGLWDGLDPGG